MMDASDPIVQLYAFGEHRWSGVWRYLLPEDIRYFRVEPERQASCHACPMVAKEQIHPDIRCCQYFPRIPNYSLGLGLQIVPYTEVLTKFCLSGAVLPEGSPFTPGQFLASLDNRLRPNSDPSIACPFLNAKERLCGLYPFRNAVCSSFFCCHEHGASAENFWTSLMDLMTQLETALSQWALKAIGFDLDRYFATLDRLSEDLSSAFDPHSGLWLAAAQDELFGDFAQDKPALFLACAQQISKQRHQLFELAEQTELRQAKRYEEALRHLARGKFREELIAEALPEGDPVSVQSLLYTVKLSYRNLQLDKHQGV